MNFNTNEIFIDKQIGSGNLNFVLIHNAGGDHQFFIHQIQLLKKYGNVIQLDLPGHGKSKAMASYKMSDLAGIIEQTCENLGLENICLIGLNNGADIALEIVLRKRISLKNLILIDPPIFMEKSFIAEIENFIQQLELAEYEQFVESLVNALFINTESDNKEIAKNAFMNVDKKALQNIFNGLIEWDSNRQDKLNNINYPVVCIITDEHHCSYNKLRQEAPQFEMAKVIGSKCWATLEVPQQINAMIERFLKINI